MLRNNDVLVLNHEVTGITYDLGRNVNLLVGRSIHENVIGAILVQVRHIATIDCSGFDLDARVEGLVNGLPGQNVLNLGAHKGRALTRLHVLEFDNLPQLAVNHHDKAVLQIICRSHYKSPPKSGEFKPWPSYTPR